MPGGALDAVYGAPLDGRVVVPAPVDLAPLLAAAHHRIRCRPAGVHAGDGVVADQAGRPEAADPAPPDRWPAPPAGAADALAAAEAPLVLAGPGVVLAEAVPGLHALAASASVGVLNTWGAKGVFDWRSRHHLATVGLQALDLDRAAVPAADLVLATGLDEAELPPGWRSGAGEVIDVDPWALGPLAEQVDRPRAEIPVPALRAELARATQAGWQATAAPLPPTKVTQHYGAALGGGGLVAADPGVPGYWVARTLATTGVGGALVPADRSAVGFAIATAIVARLVDPGRRVLAVTGPLGDPHRRLLDLAEQLGVRVAVEVWDDAGPALDAAEHERRLTGLVATGGTASIATDPAQLAEMEAVAGPIVAWRR